jgi:reductive dehalogenase
LKWLKRAEDEWYTTASEGKLFIKYHQDYHETVGGDFYEYIPLERYLVMNWDDANHTVLEDCETLQGTDDMPKRMDFEKKYNAKNAKRFNQKYDMFKRPLWDPDLREDGMKFYGPQKLTDHPGFKLEERVLTNAAFYVHHSFGGQGYKGEHPMLFDANVRSKKDPFRIPRDAKFNGNDPGYNTKIVKATAGLFGADLVGITKTDKRWLYSKGYLLAREHKEFEIDITDEYKYVIVMAVDMDYESMKYSPSACCGGAVGIGYSKMAFTAGMVAQFLNQLGYKAIPSGNDRALAVPMAIQAGLGELGRNGLLISRKYGPRIRLCKVFTDLPLIEDEPIEFGVTRFCELCKKCAVQCPGNAITKGEMTTDPINISSAEGGVRKWYVNGEKCFKFWAKNGSDCGNCIRVCPFNKPFGWLHDTTRWLVENMSVFNSVYLEGDDLFRYGKRKKPTDFWDNIDKDRTKYLL